MPTAFTALACFLNIYLTVRQGRALNVSACEHLNIVTQAFFNKLAQIPAIPVIPCMRLPEGFKFLYQMVFFTEPMTLLNTLFIGYSFDLLHTVPIDLVFFKKAAGNIRKPDICFHDPHRFFVYISTNTISRGLKNLGIHTLLLSPREITRRPSVTPPVSFGKSPWPGA